MASHHRERERFPRLFHGGMPWILSAHRRVEGKTSSIPGPEGSEVERGRKVTDYPDLYEIGRDTFDSPLSRLYLTCLSALSTTIAFREMQPEEVHEEIVRRAGQIEVSLGGEA